jgi:hypothetical protein
MARQFDKSEFPCDSYVPPGQFMEGGETGETAQGSIEILSFL